MQHYPLWIAGEARDGASRIKIDNPWNGIHVADVAVGGSEDVTAAIEAAAKAFELIRKTPAHQRAAWLDAMADRIEARADEIAAIITREAGKPITLAKGEASRAVITFRTAAEEAKRIGGEVLPLEVTDATRGRWGLTRRFPRGVVAGIVSFNFPLNLAAHKVAPALAAGCSIILKPPPQAPGATLLLAEIAKEAGVPPGAVNALFLPVEEAAPLIEDPRIAVLSFTGSAAVGWDLKGKAARKKTILELGGNAAVIVDETADLKVAAKKVAVAGYAYAGQVCIKAQRILVEQSVYSDFKSLLVEAIHAAVVCGDPAREDVLCGPVIDDAAAERITAWVAEAVKAGAQPVPLEGFSRSDDIPSEQFVAPVLLEKVPNTAKVSCEEVFGPVVTLAPFDFFGQALTAVNASRYGLQAALFTKNLERALQAFEVIEAGAVIVNDSPSFRVDPMPYGGVKASGDGREGLRYAIEEMTEMRLMVMPGS